MGEAKGLKAAGGNGPPPTVSGQNYINWGKDDQMEVHGYKKSTPKTVIVTVGYFLTVGILRLVFFWKPDWMLRATHNKCSIAEAEKVLLQDQYTQWFVETVKTTSMHGTRLKQRNHSAKYSTGKIDLNVMTPGGIDDGEILKYFNNKKLMYIWNPESIRFERLRGLEEGLNCSYFHLTKPLSNQEQARRRVMYGYNSIIVKVTPIIILLFTQILNPFYVFQIFSCILWYNDEYYYYASAIVIMSAVSLTAQIIETRSSQRALKKTISGMEVVTRMSEDGELEDVVSDTLVPGDIIEIPKNGCFMQCDAVLITGNVIVNESMLTGESVPVTKTPVPNPNMVSGRQSVPFDLKEHSRHVLFCGTQAIQTRYYGNQTVKAVVIRTGFATAKGELVRSIMFPKPVDFKFSQDAYKFIACLALISCIGMGYTLWLMISRGDEVGHIIVRTLDLITIVIPPALPAAMTIGIVISQKRLKKVRVFCISPRSINVCGAINVFCFDKTGTLTEDGLDMQGVVPVVDGKFEKEVMVVKRINETDRLMAAMATCHSLTIIDGTIQGDPLDLKMFESTEWTLEEPGEDTTKYDVFMPTVVRPSRPDVISRAVGVEDHQSMPYEIGIVRQFTFSSRLQRMSVIARTLGSQHFDLYAKGSPEMIVSLSKPNTVPSDFHDVLMFYTQQGYRVIAMAYRQLKKLNYVKIQRAQREQMEQSLTFLGLLVMENRLKPQTTPVIRQLHNAAIRLIMVTGDNMLTALSVARDCELIQAKEKVVLVTALPALEDQPATIHFNYAENVKIKEVHAKQTANSVELMIDNYEKMHFAMTGKSWAQVRKHFPEILPKLLVQGTVFARFSPEQKQQLIEGLQEVGYYVGMCGDGANDCGALKTAHTGISLSEAEASVASPFTALDQHIGCVPVTIREGRCGLVTSYGIFKYMATYSLTQFASVCLLYWIGANLTDFTFLYIDLALLTSLSITFGFTPAYPELVPKPPQVSLVHPRPILSLVVQFLINLAAQLVIWFHVKAQPWFEPFDPEADAYDCHEVTVIFLISQFQYVTMAICYSKSAPYRRSIWSNYKFLINIVLCVIVSAYLTIYPVEALAVFFELYMPPSLPFRGIIIGMAAINFFLCYLVEVYIIDSEDVRKGCEKICKKSLYEYDMISEEIVSAPNWPPVSQSSQGIAELMKLEGGPTEEVAISPTSDHVGGGFDSDMENSLPRSRTTSEYTDDGLPPAYSTSEFDQSGQAPLQSQSIVDTSPLIGNEFDSGRNPDAKQTRKGFETTHL